MIHLTFFLAAFLVQGSPAAATVPSYSAPGAILDYESLYRSGRTYETFLDEARRRRQRWMENDAKAQISDELIERARAAGGPFRLLAVAVDGCSDSVSTIPYLARLAAETAGLELRIVDADAGREIMLAHPTPDGRPATPTVLVLDAEFEEVGAFIERPVELQEWALGAKDTRSSADYLERKFAWYDQDLGTGTVREIVAIMESAAMPADMRGSFRDDYGAAHRIDASTWVHGVSAASPATYHIMEWNVTGKFAIARNAAGNEYAPGQWTRIDWMSLGGVEGMEPFTWAYCLTSYEAPSARAARGAEPADRSAPRTGCAGHPFSRMSPADNP